MTETITAAKELELNREIARLRGIESRFNAQTVQLESCRKDLARARVASPQAGLILTPGEVRVIAEALSRLGRSAQIIETDILAPVGSQSQPFSIRDCSDFKNILAILAKAP